MDFSLERVLVLSQASILCLIIVHGLRLRPQANLFALLLPLGLLVMVQGQEWWVLDRFDESNTSDFVHQYQSFDIEGARLAIWYLTASILGCGSVYCLGIISARHRSSIKKALLVPDINISCYIITSMWLALGAALMFTAVGGVSQALQSPGQGTSGGIAMAVVLCSSGKFPLLYNAFFQKRRQSIDYALFGASLMLVLVNSRFLAAFMLLQVLVIYHYKIRRVSWSNIATVGAGLFAIFAIFGLYRDFTARASVMDTDMSAWDSVVSLRAGDESLVDWFYRLNIEGFVGLASAVTANLAGIGPRADYGLSNLRVLTQMLPYSWRSGDVHAVAELHSWLTSIRPETGSVVPPGVEEAYAQFGFFGVLMFGMLLGWLIWRLDSACRAIGVSAFIFAMLSVHSLQLIRGTVFNTLLYGLSEGLLIIGFVILVWATGNVRHRWLNFRHNRLEAPQVR